MAATGSFCAKQAERKAPADEPIKLSGWVRCLKNSPNIYLSKPNKVNHLIYYTPIIWYDFFNYKVVYYG